MAIECHKNEILALSGAFQKSRILLSAVELDIFTLLKDGPKHAHELSETQGWDARGTRILLDALAAMGLLSKLPDGRFSARGNTLKLLTRGDKESILPLVLHRTRMWESWSNITEIVRTGANPVDKRTRSAKEISDFIDAMHVIGRKLARDIAGSLDLGKYRRLLDVGGGSGIYTIAFLEPAPHMESVIFDLPEVVEIAQRSAEEAGSADRIRVHAGDYRTDEFPGGFDLCLLSAVVHINSRAVNRELYAKIHRALDPGGCVLIRDHIMDRTRTNPTNGAIFAVNMLAATSGGDCYTLDEIREDLEWAGFRDVNLMRDGFDMDQLVRAEKPAQ